MVDHHSLKHDSAAVHVVIRSGDLGGDRARSIQNRRGYLGIGAGDVARVVLLGDHHAEALGVGEDVQDADMALILVHEVARFGADHDPAEDALVHSQHSGRRHRLSQNDYSNSAAWALRLWAFSLTVRRVPSS